MTRVLRVLAYAAPAIAALVVAVVLALTGDARTLRIATPLAVAWLSIAAVLAVAALVAALWRRDRRVVAERSAARATERAAAEHRRFLARLDHELKNPITAIRAAVAASDGETRQLDAIDAQTTRLSRLVGDLRKLSELQTVELERSRVEVGALVRDVVDAVREAHGREVSVTLPSAPWPLPAVLGDPDLLFVALFNVVSNAAKYSTDADVIELRGHEQGGSIVLEVADTGRGIPSGEIGGVLDELARGSNARDLPGSGLGLALVQTILQRHGGRISIASREDQGTRVRLELPHA